MWDLKDKKSLLGAKHIRRKLTFKETERFHKKSHFFSNHEKFRTKNCKVNYRSYWINCKENEMLNTSMSMILGKYMQSCHIKAISVHCFIFLPLFHYALSCIIIFAIS